MGLRTQCSVLLHRSDRNVGRQGGFKGPRETLGSAVAVWVNARRIRVGGLGGQLHFRQGGWAAEGGGFGGEGPRLSVHRLGQKFAASVQGLGDASVQESEEDEGQEVEQQEADDVPSPGVEEVSPQQAHRLVKASC